MVMGYQAYAGNGLLDGITTGVGLRKAYDDMKRQQQLQERSDNFGTALSNYYSAQDDAGRQAALQEMAKNDPVKTISFQQNQGGKSWTTDIGRMWQIANDPKETPENRQLAQQYIKYSARDPLANQGWTYAGRIGTLQGDLALGGQVEAQKTLGREQAQEQVKRQVAARDSSSRVSRIDSLIGRSKKYKDLLRPYSEFQAELGKWTDYGMTDEEREIRGELIRDVSDIKNDLIARARQNGQTGINTAREIELATKGIESSDWATLVGGLNALKNYEKVVTALENGEQASPHMSMDGTQPQEEVIDFETWMNGAK